MTFVESNRLSIEKKNNSLSLHELIKNERITTTKKKKEAKSHFSVAFVQPFDTHLCR